MKKSIQDYKKEAILNKVFNYPEGVMTRAQWFKMMQGKGATVKESTKNRLEFNRTKYNRMTTGQDEYYAKCMEIIPSYELHLPNESAFWEITKTEFEFFKNIQLAEDINTQKFELQNKIEAGIATDEEIENDAREDLENFAKYL